MIDLHTHILPGMDDGSPNIETSLQMLRAEHLQGVSAVALTPHYYKEKETIQAFLDRRAVAYDALRSAIDALPEAERAEMPRLILGAEVAWMPDIAHWDGLERLCYEDSHCLLLELSFYKWDRDLRRFLSDLANSGEIIPMIAHIDRYWQVQGKKEIEKILELGLPVQVAAEALSGFFSRARMLPYLRSGAAPLLISDCHNMTSRPPNLATAMKRIVKSCGVSLADRIDSNTEMILQL